MRIFLTGATGFIGQRLALALRQADHKVVALVRRPQAAQQLTDIGVQLAPGDLTDRDSIRAGMQGATAVIHTAALESATRSANLMHFWIAGLSPTIV